MAIVGKQSDGEALQNISKQQCLEGFPSSYASLNMSLTIALDGIYYKIYKT